MISPTSDALTELRRQFAAQLPSRLDDIRSQFQTLTPTAWHPTDAKELHRKIHSLTGSAGTFDMQPISDMARDLENRLATRLNTGDTPTESEWQTFGADLDRLEQLAQTLLKSSAPSLRPPPEPSHLNLSPLVHLVEDDTTQAKQLSQLLQDDGYRVQVFTEPAEFRAAYAATDAERPTAVVMDMIFPEGDAAGATLIAELGLGQDSNIPVVVTTVRDDLAGRLAALRAGACRYLSKPLNAGRLIDLLDALTDRQPTQPYRVLLLDDDPLLLEAQASMLREAGMSVHSLSDPLQILDAVDQFDPEVVVLDVYMPDASGPELAAVLREREAQQHLPILFLSSETDMTQQLLALNLGGDDFLVKPVQPEHLVAAVTTRARRARQHSTTRQRLEINLYEREREHLALNQHAIVSITDRAGNITYVNKRFCKISGYSRDELMGQNHRLLKSGQHPAEFYKEMWQIIGGGDVWHGEICNRRKDGSLYWVESTITPFLDGNGQPYQYVSIRTDISHVKAAKAALTESEARLNFLVTSNPVTIYTCAATPPFGATYISPNVKQWLGFEPEQFTDNSAFWAENIHPDDQQQVFDNLPQLFEHGVHHHEYRFRMNDGSYRWMHDEMRLINNDSGEASEIIGYWADVTGRKLTEQALEVHKERLRRGQIFANIGTWDWNIKSGELFWSERINPLFGYAEGELETSYDNFLNAVHPDDRQAVMDAVNACVENDTPYEIEHRVVWPDGSVRWLLERGAVMRDASGKALQMLGVVQDINDRKCAEQALQESQTKLSGLFELSPLGIALTDMSGSYIEFNNAFQKICGYPAEELKQLDYWTLTPHEYEQQEAAQLELLQKTGRYGPYEKSYRQKDGKLIPIRLNGMLVNDQSGQQRIWSIVEDITDNKAMREQLAQQKKLLDMLHHTTTDFVEKGNFHETMNDMLDTLLELTGSEYGFTGEVLYDDDDAPYLITHAITNIAWNPETNALYKELEAKGFEFRNLDTLFGQVITSRNSVVSNDPASDPRAGGLPEGHPAMHSFLGAPIFYGNELIGMYGIANRAGGYDDKLLEFLRPFDATYGVLIHSKRMSEMDVYNRNALVEAKETAERANRAKSDFLSSMSHELRTPMNAILGFGQLLEIDNALSDKQKESVQEILRAGDHLLELINEVLDLSKIESGQVELSLEAVELRELTKECLSLVTTLADKHDIHINHAGLENITVRADRTRLKQALLNLLSNAIKYNRKGGSVKLEVQPKDAEWLRIRVTDTGPGIPSDRLAELFQPFNRLDAEDSKIEGTGIGLSITRRIVEMMGGTLAVESEVGVGSSFSIELPLLSAAGPSQNEHSDATTDRHNLQTQSEATKQHTVLYIEDNLSNLKLVAQILSNRKQIQLLTAQHPQLGIELALAHTPELILLDINMPDMDGYQVLEALKTEPCLKSTPVIAITANAMPRDIERGKAAGFNDYQTKPLDVGKFLKLIDHYLSDSDKH